MYCVIHRRPWSKREDDGAADKEKKATGKEGIIHKWRRCWQVYHRVSGVIAIAIGYVQVRPCLYFLHMSSRNFCGIEFCDFIKVVNPNPKSSE